MQTQTSSPKISARTITLYLSGAMSGQPDFGYPLFNRVAEELRDLGYPVLNPAENFGGNPNHPDGRPAYFRADMKLLLDSDAIVMLPGWEDSFGANLELDIALELGFPVYEYVEGGDYLEHVEMTRREPRGHVGDLIPVSFGFHEDDELPPRASVLNEAQHLITGDRNNSYGPPTQDFRRTAEALTALGYRRLDTDDETPLRLVPSDVALMVGMVKMSRLMHSRSKRDNWTDLAGYAGCGYECSVEEAANGNS